MCPNKVGNKLEKRKAFAYTFCCPPRQLENDSMITTCFVLCFCDNGWIPSDKTSSITKIERTSIQIENSSKKLFDSWKRGVFFPKTEIENH